MKSMLVLPNQFCGAKTPWYILLERRFGAWSFEASGLGFQSK